MLARKKSGGCFWPFAIVVLFVMLFGRKPDDNRPRANGDLDRPAARDEKPLLRQDKPEEVQRPSQPDPPSSPVVPPPKQPESPKPAPPPAPSSEPTPKRKLEPQVMLTGYRFKLEDKRVWVATDYEYDELRAVFKLTFPGHVTTRVKEAEVEEICELDEDELKEWCRANDRRISSFGTGARRAPPPVFVQAVRSSSDDDDEDSTSPRGGGSYRGGGSGTNVGPRGGLYRYTNTGSKRYLSQDHARSGGRRR